MSLQAASGSAGLNYTEPTGVSKASFLAVLLCAALVLSVLAGLLIATAGGWLYGPVYDVTAPLACDGELTVESRGYSPRIDSYRAKLNVLCKDRATGVRTDVTLRAISLAFLIYSALAFTALTPVLIILARRLKPGGALYSLLPDPALPPPGSRPRGVYSGRGRSS